MDFSFDPGLDDAGLSGPSNTVDSHLHDAQITGLDGLVSSSLDPGAEWGFSTDEHVNLLQASHPSLEHDAPSKHHADLAESAASVMHHLALDSVLHSAMDAGGDGAISSVSPELALFGYLADKVMLHFQIENGIKSALEQERERSWGEGGSSGYVRPANVFDYRHPHRADTENIFESKVISFLNSAAHTLEGVHSNLESVLGFPGRLILGEGNTPADVEPTSSQKPSQANLSGEVAHDSDGHKWLGGFHVGSPGTGLRR